MLGQSEFAGQMVDAASRAGDERYAGTAVDPGQSAVRVYATTVSLPTYPTTPYETDQVDPTYRWPYKAFDRERFLADDPPPVTRTYRLWVMENEYLRLTFLPELGGRLWQAIHKPTRANIFYQNPVVKPSPWGPANQLGWLALGGLEWSAPVIEHGYDWGVPWLVTLEEDSGDRATLRIETPSDGRLLHIQVRVSLEAGRASFSVEPQVTNQASHELAFDYWQTAMLAPGGANRPSGDLHFVLPSRRVQVHSTGDPGLPPAGATSAWPVYAGRDMSRLANWQQYLGFFEHPQAPGPFVGVYDLAYDAGAVRIYPATVARGSKVFGLGWQDALDSSHFTDDDSAYVELHAGLASSFFEQARLAAGEQVAWREVWFPVDGIGDLVAAGEEIALNAQWADDGLALGIYAVRPMGGTAIVTADSTEVARVPWQAAPDAPFSQVVHLARQPGQSVTVTLTDEGGHLLLAHGIGSTP